MRQTSPHPWLAALRVYAHPRVVGMLFLGFSAGLPLLLVLGTLSFWLSEAGIERATIGHLSWVGLAYGFKFLWSPLVDRLNLPFLTRTFGRRRAWLLLSQICILLALLGMANTDPALNLTHMVYFALAVAFASATQDIALDAYRIEAVEVEKQGAMAATYQAGYRIAMITAGAGALWIAAAFDPSEATYDFHPWKVAYTVMALLMSVGMLTTLIIREPLPPPNLPRQAGEEQTPTSQTLDAPPNLPRQAGEEQTPTSQTLDAPPNPRQAGEEQTPTSQTLDAPPNPRQAGEEQTRSAQTLDAPPNPWQAGEGLFSLPSRRGGLGWGSLLWLRDTFMQPFIDFFRRYKWQALLILSLIAVYRISDVVMGVMSNPFYQEMGFTKDEVATVSKVYGVIMTIAGAALGGLLTLRIGVMRTLMLGAVLSAATNLLFVWLAGRGHDVGALVFTVSADNLSAGIASSAFVAYLSGLTNQAYSATQYALFTSVMLLLPKFIAGFSGEFVDAWGWASFFTGTAMIGAPVLILVWLAGRSHLTEKSLTQRRKDTEKTE